MDPIGAYLLVSHAWGHPLAPWGSIDGKPILDTAGDNMIEPAAAAMLAIGLSDEGPSIPADDAPKVTADITANDLARIGDDGVFINWDLVEVAANSTDKMAFDYGIAQLIIAVRDKTWKDMPK